MGKNGNGNGHGHHHPITGALLLITLGIIYGDIGTSPLYVFSAIIGTKIIDSDLILGGLSCVIWTLTMQTTVKYVILTLRADNRGEGGIMALYALVRNRASYLIYPAIIGAATLLADGLITPPISVTSAVEGLALKIPSLNTNTVVVIVCIILSGLFMFQRFGTKVVGTLFGPIMAAWFTMLGVLGAASLVHHPEVLWALNPYCALHYLFSDFSHFWILAAVFLCTTGAEALYSDLGHCGRDNIRISWSFVKVCLLLNYLGQGSLLLDHVGHTLAKSANGATLHPFYGLMPDWFLYIGIGIATMAAIIASQALITGSFTLVNEAMRLNLWTKHRVIHPSDSMGQIYVPIVNAFLWAGCIAITIFFRESKNMDAAYGLSISLTMIMTSLLICYYMWKGRNRFPRWMVWGYAIVHGTIEIAFLVANLSKFREGGYVTLLIAGFLAAWMYVAYFGRKIRNRYVEFVKIMPYVPSIQALSHDEHIAKHATHLVYLTKANEKDSIERKVLYSIFETQPKRADVYWLLHINILNIPYGQNYEVTNLADSDLIRIDFNLGFREEQRINLMFKKVLETMVEQGEVRFKCDYAQAIHEVARKQAEEEANANRERRRTGKHAPPEPEYIHQEIGDYKFVVIEKIISPENNLPFGDKLITDLYGWLKKFSISDVKAYSLDRSAVDYEQVPLVVSEPKLPNLQRIGVQHAHHAIPEVVVAITAPI